MARPALSSCERWRGNVLGARLPGGSGPEGSKGFQAVGGGLSGG